MVQEEGNALGMLGTDCSVHLRLHPDRRRPPAFEALMRALSNELVSKQQQLAGGARSPTTSQLPYQLTYRAHSFFITPTITDTAYDDYCLSLKDLETRANAYDGHMIESVMADQLNQARGYLKTPTGLVHVLCILVNIGTLLACGLRWTTEGDVYLQIIFAEFAWQTFVMACLFLTFIMICALFIGKIANPNSMFARIIGKMGMALIGICIFLTAAVFVIELWYVTSGRNSSTKMYTRIVCVMICSLILLVLLGVLLCFLVLPQATRSTVSPRPTAHPTSTAGRENNPFEEKSVEHI